MTATYAGTDRAEVAWRGCDAPRREGSGGGAPVL